jgi:hypothetical protein
MFYAGPHEGLLSFKSSLQPSKEGFPALQNMYFLHFYYLFIFVIFFPPVPEFIDQFWA